MALEDILISIDFSHPRNWDDDKEFLSHLEYDLDKYVKTIESQKATIFDGIFNKSISPSDQIKFHSTIFQVSKVIPSIIKSYLEGYPFEAFNQFNRMMLNIGVKDWLLTTRLIKINRGKEFYRIRPEILAGSDLSPWSMFHIPVSAIKFVSTQRFSVPGFPCLYMGDTLKGSAAELDFPTNGTLLDNMTVVLLKNKVPLNLLDLTPVDVNKQLGLWHDPLTTNSDKVKIKSIIYYYALLWPFIASCHSKIKYSNKGRVAFKAEYIIPQLFLQWYRSQKIWIDGVKYFSCSSAISYPRSTQEFYNYVLPVKDTVAITDYCTNLSAKFMTSEAIATNTITFTSTSSDDKLLQIEKLLKAKPLKNLNSVAKPTFSFYRKPPFT